MDAFNVQRAKEETKGVQREAEYEQSNEPLHSACWSHRIGQVRLLLRRFEPLNRLVGGPEARAQGRFATCSVVQQKLLLQELAAHRLEPLFRGHLHAR